MSRCTAGRATSGTDRPTPPDRRDLRLRRVQRAPSRATLAPSPSPDPLQGAPDAPRSPHLQLDVGVQRRHQSAVQGHRLVLGAARSATSAERSRWCSDSACASRSSKSSKSSSSPPMPASVPHPAAGAPPVSAVDTRLTNRVKHQLMMQTQANEGCEHGRGTKQDPRSTVGTVRLVWLLTTAACGAGAGACLRCWARWRTRCWAPGSARSATRGPPSTPCWSPRPRSSGPSAWAGSGWSPPSPSSRQPAAGCPLGTAGH